jgi:hypothetical protein
LIERERKTLTGAGMNRGFWTDLCVRLGVDGGGAERRVERPAGSSSRPCEGSGGGFEGT